MTCKVTIISVTASGPPLSAVHVSGTATVPDCTSVRVVLECGGSPGPKLIVPVDASGNWIADFTDFTGTPCACDRSYVVTAFCDTSPDCEKAVAKGEFECRAQCPTAIVNVTVGDCTPDGFRNVTLTATITPGTDPVIVTQWEVQPGIFAGASASLSYSVTHPYPPGQTFTAMLHVVLPAGCQNLATVLVGPLADCPCPNIDLSLVSITGCAGNGSSATATFTATLTPPGVNCGPFHWTFGDNTTAVTATPTTTHAYGTPGNLSASVAIACGACLMTDGVVVDVPQCPGGGNGGDNDGGGEGFGCFGLRVIMTIAAILAIVAIVLAVCIPAAATALGWIALGLGILAAVAAILWGIFCPKPCAWALLLAWQVSIGVGFVLLYFTACCPSFWLIGLGLLVAGVTMMLLWKRRCHKTACGVLTELAIALSSVVLPLLGWLGVIPGLAACINHIVAAALSTLAAIIAAAALHCAQHPPPGPGNVSTAKAAPGPERSRPSGSGSSRSSLPQTDGKAVSASAACSGCAAVARLLRVGASSYRRS
jgi:hypothetical protein